VSIAKQFEETLAAAGKSAQQMNHWGLTLAVVTNVNDEQKLNRVKCLPIMNDQQEETDWCYVMSPFAGKDHGQFFFPNVDDLVILGYLNGDPHRPIVLGGFWNSEVTPPYTIAEGKIHNYSIKTPGGTELLFYDEPDKQKVTLTLPSGAVLSSCAPARASASCAPTLAPEPWSTPSTRSLPPRPRASPMTLPAIWRSRSPASPTWRSPAKSSTN